MLTYPEFKKIYLEEVDQILPFITDEILKELMLHNQGWNQSKDWFKEYFVQSSLRYYKLYQTATETNVKSIIDVGGFWAIFPITMSRLGFKVDMTEALKYYSEHYNAFFNYVRSRNIEIVDYDPFMETFKGKDYDMVTVMAVIEHYPHSLSYFFNNIAQMMHASSILCLDVPNLAYIKNRINFLFGRTPLTPATIIYKSAIPYIGHHHEYTMDDLKSLIEVSPFKLRKLIAHNYTPNRMLTLVNVIKNPLIILNLFLEDTREVIYMEATKK